MKMETTSYKIKKFSGHDSDWLVWKADFLDSLDMLDLGDVLNNPEVITACTNPALKGNITGTTVSAQGAGKQEGMESNINIKKEEVTSDNILKEAQLLQKKIFKVYSHLTQALDAKTTSI